MTAVGRFLPDATDCFWPTAACRNRQQRIGTALSEPKALSASIWLDISIKAYIPVTW
jgi:hypothetical protein